MDGYSWLWWRSRNPIFPVGLGLLDGKRFGNLLLRNTRLGMNTDPDQHPLDKPWGPPGWLQPLLREGQSPRRAPPASTGGEDVSSPFIPPKGFLHGAPKAGGHCQSIPAKGFQQNLQEEELSPRGTGGKGKDVTKQAENQRRGRSEPLLWLICTEKSEFPIPSLNNNIAGAG